MAEVDVRVMLGRGILGVLSALRAPGAMEAYLLFLGREGPIVVHRACRPAGGSSVTDEFTISVDGLLSYEWFGEGGYGGLDLSVEGDFRGVELEAVRGLHSVVTREGFFDELAWRIGQEGSVGFGDVYAVDPAAEEAAARRLRMG